MANNIVDSINRILGGNPSVRKVADDLQLTSELILLVRMMFADGKLRPEELDIFKTICVSAFGLNDQDISKVIKYLKDFGYETSSWDAASMFSEMGVERKKALLVHMLKVAKSDNELHTSETELIRRTAEILGLAPKDIADTSNS